MKTTEKAQRAADRSALTLAEAKLRKSGLTMGDFKTLQFEALEGPRVQQLHEAFKPWPALKINYFSTGKTPLSSWPSHPQFYRLRYLSTPNDFRAAAGEPPRRYAQEPDTGTCAYFPLNGNWEELKNPTYPLFITEGELKAAKACKEGFLTIGLGGVSNFKSSKRGVPFLFELEKISWIRRPVYIVYDSDFKRNPQVCSALNAIAAEFFERGAFPFVCALPDVMKDGKTGLDDFLVAEGPTAMMEIVDNAQQLTLSSALWRLNEQVVYVRDPGIIVNQSTGQKYAPGAFKDHAFAHETYAERVVKNSGQVSLKKVAAAGEWLRWPLRFEVDKLSYVPGKPRFFNEKERHIINTWSGWGCEPAKGDSSPFFRLLDHLFKGAEKEALAWFIRWCAFPLQFPGVKLFTSAVFHGVRHGTGKSLIGYTLGRIYGKNFTEISQSDLHANFNEWAQDKQFVLGDDVTGSNKRQDADILKKMITQKILRVNQKFVPSYIVPDCINYLFTSNHPDAFFLEDDDRRFFIHEVLVDPLPEEFYADYDLWLDSGGAAALFHDLLQVDMADFNPAAPALRTAAKARMIMDVKSDLGEWVMRLLADPDNMLRVGDVPLEGDLFTNRQLLNIYDPSSHTGTTANGLGRELRRAGVPQANGGRPIRVNDVTERFYILRNRDRWTTASLQQIANYLIALRKKQSQKPKF